MNGLLRHLHAATQGLLCGPSEAIVMQCDRATELFSDLVSGILDPAMAVTLEGHIKECSQCRAEAGALRRTWRLLDSMEREEPPAFFRENVMARIAAEQDSKHRAPLFSGWRSLFRPNFAAAAACAAVALLCGVAHTQRASLDPIGAALRAFHGGPSTVVLAGAKAEWVPSQDGRGNVLVRLRAIGPGALRCDMSIAQSPDAPRRTLLVSGGTEVSATIPLDRAPAGALLSIKTDQAKSNTDLKTDVLVPIALPMNTPGPDAAR